MKILKRPIFVGLPSLCPVLVSRAPSKPRVITPRAESAPLRAVELLIVALLYLVAPSRAATVVVPSNGLQQALAAANPGDILELSGTYSGQFKTVNDGTAAQPITIIGDGTAVLASSKITGDQMKIDNNYYRVYNVNTIGGQKGFRITGLHGILMNCHVSGTYEEGLTWVAEGSGDPYPA